MTARTAARLGVKTVVGFTGSAIWKYVAMFPPATEAMVDAGYQDFADRWNPILDVFDEVGVRFALEVHPTEIAYDHHTTRRLLEAFRGRPTLGFNFDPSHLVWQGMAPHLFIRDFAQRIYHVHMKDVSVTVDGRTGVFGSHLAFGDRRRGWNFRSIGHGDVDFEEIIRELNAAGYTGPLSVEWEDNGMDREAGARESLAFVRDMNFSPSDIAFDKDMKR
jgi:sugar phosphate isomerase/epimerase